MSGMAWGGSEVLWGRTARKLLAEGHQVTANYKWWPHKAYVLEQIEQEGGELWLRDKPKKKSAIRQLFSRKQPVRRNAAPQWLEATRPDAVLITLGYHPDRIHVADDCIRLKIPYTINVQCASNFFFIHSDQLEEYRTWYKNAAKVYFVSEENQLKLENNIAMKLDNAEIIANPFNVEFDANPEWPSGDTMKVACVGRIHFQSKGQDMIVDVMKQEKWKNRDIEITFYGHDQGQKKQLEELISVYGLEERLKFGGFKDNVEDIWKENQALLLPSRYEGAPLVVIEAMLCNRIPIVTDIGRNRELMDDGVSGFLADGPTIRLLDQVLERAWEKRNEWKTMGKIAGTHIRSRYPEDPIMELADRLIGVAKGETQNAATTAPQIEPSASVASANS